MRGSERPWSAVPAQVYWLLIVAVAAQLAWHAATARRPPAAEELPPPPAAFLLKLASFGEPAALARVAMLWLQAFDSSAANAIPYQRLDYARLVAWLEAISAVDPRSEYPLFVAARVYAENTQQAKARLVLEHIYRQFEADPNRRWPALAHAALLAKHRLHDLPLARRYAAALQRQTTDPSIPSWATQMEVFILEDMNELEAARILLGGLLATGRIRDPQEARFLQRRLEEIEARQEGSPGGAKR